MTKHEFLSYALRVNLLPYLDAGYGYRRLAKCFAIPEETAKTVVAIYQRGDRTYFESPVRLRRRYDLAYQLETVERFLSSGQALKTFARAQGLSHATLSGWIARYREGRLT